MKDFIIEVIRTASDGEWDLAKKMLDRKMKELQDRSGEEQN